MANRSVGTAVAVALIALSAAGGCANRPASRSAAATTSPSAGASTPAPASPSAESSTPAATGAPAGPTGAGGTRRRTFDHVVVAVFENKDYSHIAGNPKAPYLNALMARGAALTNAHGVAHPSQPNYLAMFSGSTQGVTDDHCLTPYPDRPNLARQLIDAGRTFTGYSEDLPNPGYTGCTHAGYAAKHNPWVHFANVPASANQPYSAFPADFARLPTVAYVVPNLCNDMHDCGTAAGDTWAAQHLDGYLRWADSHNSLLIVTFDENDGTAGNQILTVFAGTGVKPGRYGESVDHYRVLRTIEDFYGLAPIGAAAGTSPITDIWH